MEEQVMLSFLIRDNAEIIRRVNELAAKEGTSRAAIYRRAIRMLLNEVDYEQETGHDKSTDLF